MVAPAPDLSKRPPATGIFRAISFTHHTPTYRMDHSKKVCLFFLAQSHRKGRLDVRIELTDLSRLVMGICDYEKHPVTLSFDPWFFVKVIAGMTWD
jgi:hypothetical protein